MRRNKLTTAELSEAYYGEREATGTIRNWLVGKHIATPTSVSKVEKEIPGSDKLFYFPVFELLRQEISRKSLNNFFECYLKKEPFETWNFPDLETFHPGKKRQFIVREASNTLFEFGGVYGFIAILMLLREAELNKDSMRHFELIQDAYRAFPGFARHPDLIDYWETLFNLLTLIQFNIQTSCLLVRPDIDITRKQIFSEEHITNRHERARCERTLRFLELEKPFEIASFSD